MNAQTDWTSAIAILVSGLILGAIFVLVYRRRHAAGPLLADDLERNDLYAKRDALLTQLRDLDGNASPEERRRLELETADVLRRIDVHEAAAPATAAATTTAPIASGSRAAGMNPVIKGYLWGSLSMIALAALGYFVMQVATPREEGGIATGGIEAPGQQQQAQRPPDPMVLQLESAVQKDPENLQLRNDLAQLYLERENLMGVFEQTQFVLGKAPEDSRALTFQGLVRLAMGETDAAVSMMQRATKSDPTNLDGWVSLAWVYAQTDKMDDAASMIAEAKKQSPKDSAQLDAVFAQMKQHVIDAKNAPQGQMASGAMPANHPPIGPEGTPAAAAPTTPASASAAPAGRAVTVTLDLDPSAKNRSGVLFVMARGPAGGPPVAVKRLQAAAFPMTFQLGQGDSMMGQPLPERFRLEARLDSDGDAMTKPATDPQAMQADVAVGSSVRLSLK